MPEITVNHDVCRRCGICASACPMGILVCEEKKQVPGIVHEDLCYSCGHCVSLCKSGAIRHSGFRQDTINPIDKGLCPSYEQIREMIRARRSIRIFDKKPVEQEMILNIIDAARFAPSGMNRQTTAFTVVQDPEKLSETSRRTYSFFSSSIKMLKNPVIKTVARFAGKEINGMVRILDELQLFTEAYEKGEDRILHHAPVLVLFHGEEGYAFSDVNAVLALQNASFAAWGLGLGSFISGLVMAACRRDKTIRRILSIPDGHQVFGALVVGYPAHTYSNWIERNEPDVRWM